MMELLDANNRRIHLVIVALACALLSGCEIAQSEGVAARQADDEREESPPLDDDTPSSAGSDAIDASAAVEGTASDAGDDAANQYALLVGVTQYDHLKEALWLKGPGNDVLLMQNLLREHFHVPGEHITMLTHALGQTDELLSPIRSNIKREFQRLADIARDNPDASFVVVLGGHGSQQPDSNNDGELDGYDEVFLPQDVAGWGGRQESPTIENAITDDELAGWLGDITDEGCYVCAIIDACHSGTMTRDLVSDARGEREQSRAIYWPTLNSSGAWEDVEDPTADLPAPLASRGSESSTTFLDGGDDAPRLVAIYAAQSTEPTVERLMPYGRYDIPDRNVHGLLTFTIDEVLRTAEAPLSYRELMEEVQARYDGWGRRGPTPAIEGPLDRVVFDASSVGRSAIRLTNAPEAPLSINQGGVHGLTVGTILAVYPPASAQQTEQSLGHVAVTTCGTLDAEVEPVAFEGGPLVSREGFPDGARCEIVLMTYDDHLRMGVAVDGVDTSGAPVPAEEIMAGVRELADRPGSWLRVVGVDEDPDWVITWDNGQFRIVSTCVADQVDDSAPAGPASEFGPPPSGVDPLDWLESALNRIVHVQNLRRIATLNGGIGLAGVPFDITIEPYDEDGDSVEHHPPDDDSATRPRYLPGVLAIDISNPNDFPIDVTLLYIDADYGVSVLFPKENRINRLQPGDGFPDPIRVRLTDTPVGVESLLVIAVRGEGQRVSFEMLTRSSIAEARQRDAQNVLESPLGALLRNATYQEARDGAVTQPAQVDYAMQLFTWEVLQAPPEFPGRASEN